MVCEVIMWLATKGEVSLAEWLVQDGVIGEILTIRKWVVDQTSKDYKGAI